MDREKLIKDLDNLITEVEEIKSQWWDYSKGYDNWEIIMQNDIDGLISEFEFDLEKELRGIK